MSIAVTTEQSTGASPRARARLAGLFWLLTAVGGTFAMSGGRLVVAGDGAATAANILGQELLYRGAATINLAAALCYLTATVLVYGLLAPVGRHLSLLAALASLAGCAVSGVGLVLHLAPLAMLGGAPAAGFSSDQLQSLALAFLRLDASAFHVSHVFFGLHCLLVGWLILRSRFLPRLLGLLMVGAGLGWWTMSFTNLLSPPLGGTLFPWVMLPGALGELSLAVWLLTVGLDSERWREQAAAAATGVASRDFAAVQGMSR